MLTIYGSFILNSILSPWFMKRIIIQTFPRWSIGLTADIYHLMDKQVGVSPRVTASVSQTPGSATFASYLAIAGHNGELAIVSACLFTLAAYIPRQHMKVVFYISEYVQFVSVLLFITFEAVLLVINTLLIPFILASLSYASSIPTLTLSLLILVHGVLEYVALSLLITISLQSWRCTRHGSRDVLEDTSHIRRSMPTRTRMHKLLFQTYDSVFSPQSIGNRFRLAIRPQRGSAYMILGTATLVFLAAAVVEVYISPQVGSFLLAHVKA